MTNQDYVNLVMRSHRAPEPIARRASRREGGGAGSLLSQSIHFRRESNRNRRRGNGRRGSEAASAGWMWAEHFPCNIARINLLFQVGLGEGEETDVRRSSIFFKRWMSSLDGGFFRRFCRLARFVLDTENKLKKINPTKLFRLG